MPNRSVNIIRYLCTKRSQMKNLAAIILLSVGISILFSSCKEDKEETPEPKLIFKFKFDSTQARLDGFGQPSAIPANHFAQSPRFNKMSSHYIELAPTAFTALGSGAVLYRNDETTAGGDNAIDFEKSILAGQNETFFSVPLANVAAGTYQYLRVSLAYQNYDINFRVTDTVFGTFDLTGTLASFIGFNTYIKSFKIKDSTLVLNDDRKQGYWAFELHYPGFPLPQYVSSGQAPEGATTVPNPINSTSPIPAGSCVVTGAFSTPLTISGNETQDIVITVSLSVNKSFEWVENSNPDYFEPAAGDTVVDMGVRGLIPIIN